MNHEAFIQTLHLTQMWLRFSVVTKFLSKEACFIELVN